MALHLSAGNRSNILSTSIIAGFVFWVASRLIVYEVALSPNGFPQNPTAKNRLSHTRRGDKEPMFLVVIDPGHGGSALGACSPSTRICEKDLTLHLALQAKETLEKIPGVRVFLTRYDDFDRCLHNRTTIAQELEADLFISLHANASPKRDQHGFEVYVYPPSPGLGENTVQLPQDPMVMHAGDWHVNVVLGDLQGERTRDCSILFGKLLLDEMERNLTGRENRGLKQKGLAVLSRLKMPGILLEVGFLDHPQEGRLLLQKEFQEEILQSLKESLSRWLKKDDECRMIPIRHAGSPEDDSDEYEFMPPFLRREYRRRKRKENNRHLNNTTQNAPWRLSPRERSGLLG